MTTKSRWHACGLATYGAVLALGGGGCHETNTRTEVVPNAQGGVEVRHVPKDERPQTVVPRPAERPVRSSSSDKRVADAPAPPSPAPAPSAAEQRIEALEAQ